MIAPVDLLNSQLAYTDTSSHYAGYLSFYWIPAEDVALAKSICIPSCDFN